MSTRPGRPSNPRDRKWHEILDRLLADLKERRIIQTILRWADLALRLRK